ncbi:MULTISPECIES: DUF1810 domain-containing protein [Methylorubrum]|uniref:DUF1810 domain-containing protein n=1 Tax=Methylorubrum TaxID=2282523 RepID=UPI00097270DB|nr:MULTISPECIES: DUF1810 domain-containing protein [Methylorubrum]MDF9861968.1 uncharacterized protein (DUF1810 family) [Methylorubrum pseudosasae]MDH6635584.1 uncharacterized protein (DUF1810 family) [Methylobacterium sp. SuP10 SLI 274]MDH6664760.1 uncharacterized protein (DUF1810 family) [Methylorubrum zatmanii]APX84009.1 calpastatin [Methylorubrum extorquens]MCP1561756.1 uncharacterized protein (DUF1810 family) [Methylorubrum extorquens]
MPDDAFDLNRFVEAQDGLYADALAEMRNGRKQSHWMWFIFPQIAGLGSSAMARRYAIRSLAEAQAYLAHPLLGERLRTCTRAANAWEGRSAHALFGAPDDVKFRSSMTLFAQADPDDPDFARALSIYFEGRPDPLTLERLEQR